MKKAIVRPRAVAVEGPDDVGRRVLLFVLFSVALVMLPAVFA